MDLRIRSAISKVVFTFLIGGWLHCSAVSQDHPAGSVVQETPRQYAERQLDQPVAADYVDTPLGDIRRGLSKQFGLPIRLVDEGANASPLYDSAAITIRCKGISLGSCLNLLLHPRQSDHRVSDQGEILIVGAAESQLRQASRPQQAAATRHARLLECKRIQVGFVDSSLKDVLAWLSDETGEPFFLDPVGLAAVGVQPESLINCVTSEAPMHQVLTAILTPHDLRVECRNEVLFVTKRVDRLPRRNIPAAIRRLAESEVSWECHNRPLMEVVQELIRQSEQADKPAVLLATDRWRVEAAGIDVNKQITCKLQRVPLRNAMTSVLLPAGLQLVVYDEVLFVTPIEPVRMTDERSLIRPTLKAIIAGSPTVP
jgi:hypothetical protein